jgi:hypothetical protein
MIKVVEHDHFNHDQDDRARSAQSPIGCVMIWANLRRSSSGSSPVQFRLRFFKARTRAG